MLELLYDVIKKNNYDFVEVSHGLQVEEGTFKAPAKIAHTHIGSLGNLALDKIQEKFDNVFMTLDMMECDRAIKAQAKVELSSIYFFTFHAFNC